MCLADLGALTMWDAQIGRLMDILEEKNVADSTAIFYTADNGAHQVRFQRISTDFNGFQRISTEESWFAIGNPDFLLKNG